MKYTTVAKLLVIFVGISGCFSVLFGAWLAHGGQTLPLASQERLTTALSYQFFHTLMLMLTVILYKLNAKPMLLAGGILFMLGILCFSGSLYIKTLFDVLSIGKLAPFGGLSFALAWLLVGFAGTKMFDHKLGK
ncbi:DUF423 domain-containing protein [Colwellia sp. M166]|jgi:uncharacterized membrane protein YgdD (TMEM256/DUF423 family)|uniref:DUF423 domain-containing protein n=1 Tax=Colwellia sp. M166 TaxID=2583805 RepID=UPI00211EDAB0|nr:DUF423 domain-containing protein [Colwellia sp. M166]UUO21818.1 DUF423 domain-containing protein [Colwellia sp. M166]|tara:strand:+ start:65 stop:466 length:402 start_codon:yes stop_codon:yes gene_type:complete